jgi:hypothetical protein
MSGPLHEEFPDRYEARARCAGSGTIRCRGCDGKGSVVGPDYYFRAGRIGRRFGLKVCTRCHGRGTLRCGVCVSGSIPKT